jgi:predicted Na+-dependent transporter
VIIATLIVGLASGFFSTAPGFFIRRFATLLIVIMIGAMGFTIRVRSLGRALKDGWAFILGLALNFIFAPLLCWVLAATLLAGHPDLAAGLILIGVVPCAGMALVWTGLLKGDVPLATVVNAATMIAAPFLIPGLMRLLAGAFIAIDTGAMFWSVMLTVLAPIIGGILIREALERQRDMAPDVPFMPAVSASAAVFLMFMAVNTSVPLVRSNLVWIGPLTASMVLVFPILFIGAYAISRAFLPTGKNIAITFSSGMKNLPIAVAIAAVSFNELAMFPVALGFAFQMIPAVCFYRMFMKTQVPNSSQPASGRPSGAGVRK